MQSLVIYFFFSCLSFCFIIIIIVSSHPIKSYIKRFVYIFKICIHIHIYRHISLSRTYICVYIYNICIYRRMYYISLYIYRTRPHHISAHSRSVFGSSDLATCVCRVFYARQKTRTKPAPLPPALSNPDWSPANASPASDHPCGECDSLHCNYDRIHHRLPCHSPAVLHPVIPTSHSH